MLVGMPTAASVLGEVRVKVISKDAEQAAWFPNLPRRPLFRSYQPPTGRRANAPTFDGPVLGRLLPAALPSAIQPSRMLTSKRR